MGPVRSEIASLSTTAGCCEYIDGPILLLSCFPTSSIDIGNLEFTSRTTRPVFSGAISHMDPDTTTRPTPPSPPPAPNRLIWNQKLVIDSATIGDVLVGTWNVWVSGPSI